MNSYDINLGQQVTECQDLFYKCSFVPFLELRTFLKPGYLVRRVLMGQGKDEMSIF